MIPIKLTIQGLYSYQEKQTIDFTRLTEANLFGIFGSVGSGKSSILEAITFAIYGKTDRLNLSGDNRNYNMMNLKSNDLLIEFVFETGKDQTAYQAVVKGRRNGKKFEEVKTLERSAYRNDGDSWIPIEPEQLEKAIGLSYDNFKRTIIIPQGQFQEFLQLGNKDRTQMMKELFNLERFELYYKVASLENKNNAQKQNLEGQLQQLGVIDPELLKLYGEKLNQLKLDIGQLSKSLNDQQKLETEWKKLQELVRKLDEFQPKLKQLNAREPEFVDLETMILNYEYCLVQFKNQLDALAQSERKIALKTDLIAKEAARVKLADESIQRSEKEFDGVKLEYEQRDRLHRQVDELVKIGRLNVLQETIQKGSDRLGKGNQELARTMEWIEKLKLGKEKLENDLKTEKEKLPDLNLLSRVKIWHAENKNLNRQLTEINEEISRHQNEMQLLNEEIKVRFSAPIFAGMSPEIGADGGILFLNEKVAECKKQISVLDQQLEHYRVQARLEEYVVNLHDGEACPLCGSEHHPAVLSPESVSEALQQANGIKLTLEKEIAAATEQIAQLSEQLSREKLRREQINGLLGKQKIADQKLKEHSGQFVWDGYRDEQVVNEAFAKAEVIQGMLKEKEAELEKLRLQVEKESLNKEKYQAELEKIKTAQAVAQAEVKTLSAQIVLLNALDYRHKTSSEIESEKQVLVDKNARIEKQFTHFTNRLMELRKEKDSVSGSLDANRKELLGEQELFASLQKELESRLLQSKYSSIEEVRKVLAKEINLETEKKKVADFRQQLVVVQNQVQQAQHEIENRTYEPEKHQQLLVAIHQAKEELNQRNQELGKAEELLRKLQRDLESQAQLRKELERLELRAENIKTMKSLFKASGFVNYISSVYLQNLCNAANDRFFQLTRQKLSLEITEDNNFQVRDFLNGGKVRSVKTLSGGQTFQAALSLALALADNIQKITDSNQNFFFLDEGFGSLDKDSLAVVFDTLKSLRKENRIVGVISHVEEMQQEIDTHLRIENHEETGSRILPSWE
ncbi:MAG: AAA family ATPase [Prolixibacteraceae bacterium]|nr:AAA family ATPase [Prolixibacteraceae bacterium]